MVITCCARFCANRAKDNARQSGIHFYRIPQAGEKRELWLNALKRKGYNPGPNTYICSVHFAGGEKDDDPESPGYAPSIFDPEFEVREEQKLRRYAAMKRRSTQREERLSILQDDMDATEQGSALNKENEEPCSYEQLEEKYTALTEECRLKTAELSSLRQDHVALTAEYRLRTTELTGLKQLSALGRGFPNAEMLEKDSKLTSFFTGIPNYSIFQSLFKFVTSHLPTTSQRKLTHFQCFLLTLMKLRLAISNYDLGFRYGIHDSTVSRILTKWIQLMDVRLSPLVQWPDKEQLKKTMPWCFRQQYGLKVTSIIDCFELFIEKPGDLMSKAATWSTYKHYNTAKYLISVTPQGTVSFLSKGYGGRVSDKFITENSGYLSKISPGDVILADRGFNVEESIGYMGGTLVIPAYTRGKPQLPPEAVESTRRLANVRIHVERVIGSVRQRYQILSATTPLPTEYTRSKKGGPVFLDSIVRICCALGNVCDSIIPAT